MNILYGNQRKEDFDGEEKMPFKRIQRSTNMVI